jgi:hypothetical protein
LDVEAYGGAQHVRVDGIFEQSERGEESTKDSYGQNSLMGFSRLDHFFGVGGIGRDWFFDQDVNAFGKKFQCGGCMMKRGGAQDHRIGIGCIQGRCVLGYQRDSVGLRKFSCAGAIPVYQRRELCFFMSGDDGHMVFFGDCSAADDRDPYPTGLIPNTPH